MWVESPYSCTPQQLLLYQCRSLILGRLGPAPSRACCMPRLQMCICVQQGPCVGVQGQPVAAAPPHVAPAARHCCAGRRPAGGARGGGPPWVCVARHAGGGPSHPDRSLGPPNSTAHHSRCGWSTFLTTFLTTVLTTFLTTHWTSFLTRHSMTRPIADPVEGFGSLCIDTCAAVRVLTRGWREVLVDNALSGCEVLVASPLHSTTHCQGLEPVAWLDAGMRRSACSATS